MTIVAYFFMVKHIYLAVSVFGDARSEITGVHTQTDTKQSLSSF